MAGDAFIENPKKYLFINHIDNDKINNNVKNLERCSDEQNHNHALKNKLKYRKYKTSFFGISFYFKYNKWTSIINYRGKVYKTKYYKNDICAAIAYNLIVLKHGLNKPLNKF